MARKATQKVAVSRAKLTNKQKDDRRKKAENLTQELATAHKGYQAQAREIAKKYGRTFNWTKSQLYLGGKFTRQRRSASAWNAFVRKRLQDANKDRAAGSKWKLKDFVNSNVDKLKADYARLSVLDKKHLREGLATAREAQATATRTNPKALGKYVDATFTEMDKDWTAITHRTGLQAMYFAVRSGIDQIHEPKVFLTAGADSFIREVLGQEPRALALRFEAWAVSKLTDQVLVKGAPKLRQAISLCRSLIQEGLDRILAPPGQTKPKKPVKMNYDNYEAKIVEALHVALKGYPCLLVANPGTIGRDNVYKLLDALQGSLPTCYWVRLSAEEVEARKKLNAERVKNGEAVYKARKQSNKRKRTQPKSVEVIASSDESSSSSDDDN
ncbi:hypothetical protein C8Q76DRAFT_800938 [Earliella scabrosa]|nr:hypothetical protein C8Q76DRAFT_800938 [Earliella scabrosa]